jgi:hypothetical protein
MDPFVIVTDDPAPVANSPLAPVPLVVTVFPVNVIAAARLASTPAFVPYWLLLPVFEELPVVLTDELDKLKIPLLVTRTPEVSVMEEE